MTPDSNPTTKLDCPYGFNGSQEQLLNALRHTVARDSASSRHVKDAAVWFIEHLSAEVDRLKEYEWMYKDLCK